MESAIKLAERFIASVSRHSPATADVAKARSPSTPEAETNPHQYDGPPHTAEQAAAQVRHPRLRSGIFSALSRRSVGEGGSRIRPPIPIGMAGYGLLAIG